MSSIAKILLATTFAIQMLGAVPASAIEPLVPSAKSVQAEPLEPVTAMPKVARQAQGDAGHVTAMPKVEID